MIKAIETQYKGYRFRSRLEARWAVFFDKLGVKWEYEKEGYELSTGWYLPDFWLPDFGFFVEIKPGNHTGRWEHADGIGEWVEEAEDQVVLLPVVLIAGDPIDYTMWNFTNHTLGYGSGATWKECFGCHQIAIGDVLEGDFYGVSLCCCESKRNHSYSAWWKTSSLIEQAAIAARSARFEHGEQGNTRTKGADSFVGLYNIDD